VGFDGLGQHVVRRKQEEGLSPGVEATNAGTTVFFALLAMSGADHAIVVDGVETEDASPGTIRRYRYSDGSFDGSPPAVQMHDFSFSAALRTGDDANDLPVEVVVIGVKPAATDPGVGLCCLGRAGVKHGCPAPPCVGFFTRRPWKTAWNTVERQNRNSPGTPVRGRRIVSIAGRHRR
jgi:hydrogenase maturation protease